MQSASVIIETPLATGQQPAQRSGGSAVGSGMFGNELEQQQRQIEEKHALKSRSSSASGEGDENRSESSRNEVSAQQERGDSSSERAAASHDSKEHDSSAASESDSDDVELSLEVDETVSSEALQGVVVDMPNRAHRIKVPDNTLDVELKNKVLSIMASGNNLPLNTQSEELIKSAAELMASNIEGGHDQEQLMVDDSEETVALIPDSEETIALFPESEETIALIPESEETIALIPESEETIVLIPESVPKSVLPSEKRDGLEGESTDIEVKGSTLPEVVTDAEQIDADQSAAHKAVEVDPQVVIPSAVNAAQVSSNDADGESMASKNSAVSVAANAASNQSTGAGAGSNNSNFTGNRQPSSSSTVAQPQAEGEAEGGELKQPLDKSVAFSELLKSSSKGESRVIDAQAASQSGAKPQVQQLSQMISQLSSIQSGGQSQAATTVAGAAIPQADSTPAMMTIATSMRQQGWDRAMGERLVFMARNGVQEAKIQVNPRQMGPIDIKVSVNQEQQANVTFVTANSAARETIDAAMPRLREMFDQAGLDLAESEVSQRDHQQSAKGEAADDERRGNMLEDEQGEVDDSLVQQVGYVRPSGLDLFA